MGSWTSPTGPLSNFGVTSNSGSSGAWITIWSYRTDGRTEGREREREGDEGDEGDEGREREREGDEGDEGHEVSWHGVIGAWAWLRGVVVSTSLLSVGQKMQLNLCRGGRTR